MYRTAAILILPAILAGCNLTKPSAHQRCGVFRAFALKYAEDEALREARIKFPLRISYESYQGFVVKVYATRAQLPPLADMDDSGRLEHLGESYLRQLSWPYFPTNQLKAKCSRNGCRIETTPYIGGSVSYDFVCAEREWLLTEIKEGNEELATKE